MRRIKGALLALSLLLALACKDREDNKSGADLSVIPDSLKRCTAQIRAGASVSDDCIDYDVTADHFLPDGLTTLSYVYVNSDGESLRAEPSFKSAFFKNLPISSKVTVLFRASRVETIQGKRGHWAFVYVQSSTPYASEETARYGWIFDAFLSFRDDFSVVRPARREAFCDDLIDGSYCVILDPSLSRVLSWEKESGVTQKSGVVKQHRSLLFVETSDGRPFVLVRNDGLYAEIDNGGGAHDADVERFIERERR